MFSKFKSINSSIQASLSFIAHVIIFPSNKNIREKFCTKSLNLTRKKLFKDFRFFFCSFDIKESDFSSSESYIWTSVEQPEIKKYWNTFGRNVSVLQILDFSFLLIELKSLLHSQPLRIRVFFFICHLRFYTNSYEWFLRKSIFNSITRIVSVKNYLLKISAKKT